LNESIPMDVEISISAADGQVMLPRAFILSYIDFMSLEAVSEKVKQKIALAPQMGASVKFDFGDDGVIFIDGNQTPPEMSYEDKGEADVTLITSLDTFNAILDGTQDPNIAFMMCKLKVKGNMDLAMKLNSILED